MGNVIIINKWFLELKPKTRFERLQRHWPLTLGHQNLISTTLRPSEHLIQIPLSCFQDVAFTRTDGQTDGWATLKDSTASQWRHQGIVPSIHPSIHSTTFFTCLPLVRPPRQQSQQGAPGFPFPGHISQLWLGDPKVISPSGPGPSPGPLSSWSHLEHLSRAAPRRHPFQMPKLPQLAPFNAKEQWHYSKSIKEDWTFHLIPEGDASHPPEETHFSLLYPRSHYFNHDPSFMTIGVRMNEDWLVDQELCLLAWLSFCHKAVVLFYQGTNSLANLPRHSPLTREQDLKILELLHLG